MADKFNTDKINLDVLLVKMACGPSCFSKLLCLARVLFELQTLLDGIITTLALQNYISISNKNTTDSQQM